MCPPRPKAQPSAPASPSPATQPLARQATCLQVAARAHLERLHGLGGVLAGGAAHQRKSGQGDHAVDKGAARAQGIVEELLHGGGEVEATWGAKRQEGKGGGVLRAPCVHAVRLHAAVDSRERESPSPRHSDAYLAADQRQYWQAAGAATRAGRRMRRNQARCCGWPHLQTQGRPWRHEPPAQQPRHRSGRGRQSPEERIANQTSKGEEGRPAGLAACAAAVLLRCAA